MQASPCPRASPPCARDAGYTRSAPACSVPKPRCSVYGQRVSGLRSGAVRSNLPWGRERSLRVPPSLAAVRSAWPRRHSDGCDDPPEGSLGSHPGPPVPAPRPAPASLTRGLPVWAVPGGGAGRGGAGGSGFLGRSEPRQQPCEAGTSVTPTRRRGNRGKFAGKQFPNWTNRKGSDRP